VNALGFYPPLILSVSLAAESTLDKCIMGSLEERLVSFVGSLINAEVVDDIEMDSVQRAAEKPDFFFYDRQFIAEMKSLKQDMKDKADRVMDMHRERPEYPLFFGDWLIDKVLKSFPDRDQIMNDIGDQLTAGLEFIVKKANRQIREAKKSFGLGKSHGVLIVLNDTVEVLSPEVLAFGLNRLLLKKKGPSGEPRFSEISAVWILSDLHVIKTPAGTEAIPSITITNVFVDGHEEATDYLQWLQEKWAAFNGSPFIPTDIDIKSAQFAKRKQQKPQPELLPNHEIWIREYSRVPYLEKLTKDELFKHGKQIFSETTRGFLKGDHDKPDSERMKKLMEIGTHFLEEINRRGIDFRDFQPVFNDVLTELKSLGIIWE
jgi:hypothetical protein